MFLPELDLRDPGFWQNPFPVLNELRERSRVALTHDGTKLILRHADVSELLGAGAFVNEGVSLLARRGFRPGDPLYEYRRQALGALAGDEHRRVRALVGKALNSTRVESIRDIVERRLPPLLEPLLNREVDVLASLTGILPLAVIGEYLGIDEGDRFRVDALVREGQAKAFGREVTSAIVARSNAIFAELMAFVTAQIENRRLAPHNDVLAHLLAVEEGAQVLSQQEIIVLFLNLFIGAIESTASSMASGLLALAQQPRLLAELRARPESVAAFVEENLRLFPPNTLLANKIAREHTEFCGVYFSAGESVIVPIPAPNRDTRVFERADEFDLRRPPQRHFSFSLGSHFCLGQALARLQLLTFFRGVTTRVRAIELLQGNIEWEPFAAITSMKTLRLRFMT